LKRIRFQPNAPSEIRAIERRAALQILHALHRYAETGEGDIKALSGSFEGLLRLRVRSYQVLFDETEDAIYSTSRPGSPGSVSVNIAYSLFVQRRDFKTVSRIRNPSALQYVPSVSGG
jgi:mRNA interferase RelE/StbE